jgi:hypothetical protein
VDAPTPSEANTTAATTVPAGQSQSPATNVSPTPLQGSGDQNGQHSPWRLRTIAIAAAIGGMVFGGTVEYFVGNLIDSTGWFGPTLDALVEQQNSNFEDIRAKLEELKKAPPGSPEAAKIQGDLQTLLLEQEKLIDQTHSALRMSEQEVTRLKQEMLAERGSATGADFYLSLNESITVHARGMVFALVAAHRNGLIDVNLSGKTQRLKPGDFIEFTEGDSVCKVFYKIPRIETTGKIGFDLVCAPGGT